MGRPMNNVALGISRLSMLAFLVSSMLAVGLSLTVSEIIGPLRSVRLVVAGLLANFILVPLIAVGAAKLLQLEQPFAIGLLLLGLAPGAPFLPKLIELMKGDLACSVGLLVLLMAGSMVFLPLALPRLLPGVEVSIWQIARPLLFLMALPLSAGLILRARYERFAARCRPGLNRVANATLCVVLVFVIGLNLPGVLHVFGTGAVAAAVLFTAVAAIAGHLLGGPGLATRRVMALGTGFRNIAAALVVAEEDFPDPKVSVMLVVTALLGLVILLPATVAWGRRAVPVPAMKTSD